MIPYEFEQTFFDLLRTKLQPGHPKLSFTIPPSGMFSTEGHSGPSPDLIVTNSLTGHSIVFEVKGTEYGDMLPFGTLPQLKALRNTFPVDTSDLVIIHTADVPEPVRNALTGQGITFIKVTSPNDAIEKVMPAIETLEKENAG